MTEAALAGEFSLERDLAAAPAPVFAAYGADPALRRRWFRVPGDPSQAIYQLDFRPGGGEVSQSRFAPSGVAGTEELIEYRSVFWDLVPAARLVLGYELVLDGVRRWVSQVTVELSARDGGAGTWLRHTEQYVFLAYSGDGAGDVAHLAGGTRLQLNGLAAVVGDSQPATRAPRPGHRPGLGRPGPHYPG
jgi:uncharacterized protein YndB with AHSA1/START domain